MTALVKKWPFRNPLSEALKRLLTWQQFIC